VGQPDEPVRRVVGIRGSDSVLTRSRPLISPCGLPAAVYLTDSHLSRFKRFGGEAAHMGVGIAGQWAAVKPDGGDSPRGV
jgi:hypothetical protein